MEYSFHMSVTQGAARVKTGNGMADAGLDQSATFKPPANVAELITMLDAAAGSLPKRLAQCAAFTRQHLHLPVVSTVADMASAAGVAPSVYMRFCQSLGFKGYSELQALLRERFTDFRPRYDERLARLGADRPADMRLLLAEFAEAGHQSLLSLANTVTAEALDRIAEEFASARSVQLVGARRAFAVVSNMAYLLGKIGIPAILHPATGLIAPAVAGRGADVVFAVSFAPFSPETITQVAEAASAGATVHALSDSDRCPLAEHADTLLIARESEVGGFRGLSGAIQLTTALCVAAGAYRQTIDKQNETTEAE